MSEVGGRSKTETRSFMDFIEEIRDTERVARPEVRPEKRPERGSTEREPNALWDVSSVAAYLHIPASSIYKMTARKAALRIPHIRLGGKLRFRRSDVDHWLTLL